VLPSPPLMSIGVQGAGSNIWLQLGAIIAANVVVIQVRQDAVAHMEDVVMCSTG